MVNLSATIASKIAMEKLLLATERALIQNRAVAKATLEEVKMIVHEATPLGPGHFGYHGRDTLKVDVKSTGLKTSGRLLAAIQLYWREYGTLGRFRGPKRNKLRQTVGIMTGRISVGGEPAYMTAHKAAGVFKRFVAFYYGGMANWWKS